MSMGVLCKEPSVLYLFLLFCIVKFVTFSLSKSQIVVDEGFLLEVSVRSTVMPCSTLSFVIYLEI